MTIDTLHLGSGSVDSEVVRNVRMLITDAEHGKLAQDKATQLQTGLKTMIEQSPNPELTAKMIMRLLEELQTLEAIRADFDRLQRSALLGIRSSAVSVTSSGNRPPSSTGAQSSRTTHSQTSSNVSRPATRHVRSGDGLCRLTGSTYGVENCHIIPHHLNNSGNARLDLCKLLEMYLPETEVNAFIDFLYAPGQDEDRLARNNIDGWKNLISIRSDLHTVFDQLFWVLEVDWDTYDVETGEFTSIFRDRGLPCRTWAEDGTQIVDGKRVEIRHLHEKRYPLPSPTFLYIRQLLTTVVRMVGGGEEIEDDLEADREESYEGEEGRERVFRPSLTERLERLGLSDKPGGNKTRVSRWLDEDDGEERPKALLPRAQSTSPTRLSSTGPSKVGENAPPNLRLPARKNLPR